MTIYSYNGKKYHKENGIWCDYKNRRVSNEIEDALNRRYSVEAIKKRQAVRDKNLSYQNPSSGGLSYRVYSTRELEKKYLSNYSSSKPRDNYYKKSKNKIVSTFSTLSDEQKRALRIMETGENIFLSGEAGTGKSFLLNEFIYRNKNKNIVVCAPTGIAAINVGGSTIHRVFGAPIGIIRHGEYNKNPSKVLIKADIIVIDEISMCRIDLFEYIIRTTRKAEVLRKQEECEKSAMKYDKNDPYQAKQIIIVGDFYQLPPVVKREDYEIFKEYYNVDLEYYKFPFQSILWEKMHFKNIILKEIMRQKGDLNYIKNLNKIRMGDKSGIEWFNENIRKEAIPNSIYICGTNVQADEINMREAGKLQGKSQIYSATIKNQVHDNDKVTSDYLELKLGMQVMTLVNDTEAGYQNGSIGIIKRLGSNYVTVQLQNGRIVTVKPYEWEITGYEIQDDKIEQVVYGNYTQLPLKIAYAITIHKSQGQTYSSVNISPKCFDEGQLYVALSRAMSSDRMSLECNIQYNWLMTSEVVKRFYNQIGIN